MNKEGRKTFTFSLPESFHHRLKMCSSSTGLNISQFVEVGLEGALLKVEREIALAQRYSPVNVEAKQPYAIVPKKLEDFFTKNPYMSAEQAFRRVITAGVEAVNADLIKTGGVRVTRTENTAVEVDPFS